MPVIPALIAGASVVGGAAIASNSANRQSRTIQNATNDSNALQLQIFNQQRADLAPWRQTGERALSQIERLLGIQGSAAPGGQPGQTSGQTGFGGLTGEQELSLSPGVNFSGMVSPNANDPQTPTTPQGTGTGQQGQDRYGGFYASPGYQFRLDQGMNALNANAATRGSLQSGSTLRALQRHGQDYASSEFNNYVNQLFNVAGYGQTSTGQGNALASNYANNVSNNNLTAAQARASSYGTQANTWQNALGSIGGMALYGGFRGGGQTPPSDLMGLY